jgi:hypothetical protein
MRIENAQNLDNRFVDSLDQVILEVANAPDPDVCVRIITCLQWPIRVKQLEPPGEAFPIFCGCLDL